MREKIYDIYRDKKLTAKFITIGGIGFLCNYLVLRFSISEWGVNRVVAEILAALVALQVTFILHDNWTYKIDKTIRRYHLIFAQRYRAYLMSNSFASLSTVIFFAIFSIFLDHLLSLALAALIGLAWNFFVNKNIIWRHKQHEQISKND